MGHDDFYDERDTRHTDERKSRRLAYEQRVVNPARKAVRHAEAYLSSVAPGLGPLVGAYLDARQALRDAEATLASRFYAE